MRQFLWEHRWYVLLNVFSLTVIFGSIWYVIKPAPLPPLVSNEEVVMARQLGLEWLLNNTSGGLFRYEFDPEINTVLESNNELRQLMASRVAASAAHADERFYTPHAENISYVLSTWYLENNDGGFVLYQGKSKLGASAMLLRTLVASPDFGEYTHEAAQLAQGIMALQQPDGSFVPWYVEPDYEYDAEYLMHFYSGEAMLALLEYYEKSGDQKVFMAVQNAANYYLRHYVEAIASNYHPAYVPWHTMVYARLFAHTGDARYERAVYTMNDRLLELLDTTIHPGRFYKLALEAEGQQAPHTSSDAVYLEGLLYAYELAVQHGDTERAETYKEAIQLAATRLVNLQYQETKTDLVAQPETYVGAIPIREGNRRIRVDTTQHALDAFTKYLEVFAGEEGI